MEEQVFLQEGDVSVSNARATLGGKTYAMANITSVAMAVTPASRKLGIIIAIVGFLIFLAGASNSTGGALFGILVLAGGTALAAMAKATYVVRLGSASGEADGLTSKDRAFIDRIVGALNKAMVARG
jgi:hypothetical protein